MLCVFLCAWLLMADVETYQVQVGSTLDGYRSEGQPPLAVVQTAGQHMALTADGAIHGLDLVQDQTSQIAVLPELAAFRGLFLRDNQLVAVDMNGFRQTTFDLSGKRVGQFSPPDPCLYADRHNELRAFSPLGPADMHSLELVWIHKNEVRHLEWVPQSAGDLVSINGCAVVALGRYALAVTQLGQLPVFYYVLLDLEAGLVLSSGQQALLGTPVPPDPLAEVLPGTVGGLFAHPTLGFVLNEQVSSQTDPVVRILNPQTGTWRALRLQIQDNAQWRYFWPVEADQWMGFNGNGLTQVQFRRMP